MASIERKDIISDDALDAPRELSRNILEAVASLDKLIQVSKGASKDIGDATSSNKVAAGTKDLTLAQQELGKVQKQIQVIQAKSNDGYIQEVKALDAVKRALKDKILLGDRDAKTVNAQNASLKVLEAALNKNINSYKNFATAEQRATKEAIELHKIIQLQDTDVKKLNGSLGDFTDSVGGYEQAFGKAGKSLQQIAPGAASAANGILGMVKASLAFLATPIGIVVAALGAAIFALTSYFKGSEEGQNRLNKIMAIGSAIFEQFMNVVEDIGEALFDAFTNPKQAVSDLWEFIKQNFVNRIVGLIELFPALGKAISLAFKGNFAEAGKVAVDAVAKVALGITNVTGKVEDFIKTTNDLVEQGVKNGERLADLNAKIDKDERKLVEDRAAISLKVAKLREQAVTLEGEARRRVLTEAIALEEKLSAREVALARTRLELAALTVKANGDDKEALNALAEARAAVSQAEETAFSNTLKFRKQLQALDDEEAKRLEALRKERLAQDEKTFTEYFELNKSSIVANAEAQQRALDDQIIAIKKAAIERGATSDEVDKEIAKKQKDLADDYVQIQIDALEKSSAAYGTSAEEKAKIDQEIYKLRLKLTDIFYDQIGEKEKTWAEKSNAFIDKYKQAFIDTITALSDLSAAFTERRLQDLDLESEANEAKKNDQIEREKSGLEKTLENETLTAEQRDALKESSAKRQEAIELTAEKREKDIEDRRKKAVRKQAIFDKAVALAIGGIKLAQAVLAMLSVGPAGFALSAIAAAIGAIQLATIAARPIPAAEKGLKDHKGGLVLAGEKGDELIKSDNGWSMTSGKGIYNVAKHAQIFPHEQSMQMIAMAGMRPPDRQANDSEISILKDINKSIKNQPKPIIKGEVVGYKYHGTRVSYVESLRNR